MGNLDDKVAIVTGAGIGMGRATALHFARQGAKVVAADISGKEVDTASEHTEAITPFHADVAKAADVEALVAEAVSRHGRLDVMCNVVGIVGVAQQPVPDIDEDEYDLLMAVNLKSIFLGMKYAIPAMVASGGGSIVNWSSVGGLVSAETTGPYSASKAGILGFTRAAAREWGRKNVRVNAICPGFIYPTGQTLLGEEMYPELVALVSAKSALERVGSPDEVAAAAAFLASDAASFVTGTYLVVDGGWTAG